MHDIKNLRKRLIYIFYKFYQKRAASFLLPYRYISVKKRNQTIILYIVCTLRRLFFAEELRFEKKASSVTVAKGEKAELKCQPFSSDKRMSKWWRRNGITLEMNGDRPLTISNASSNDCGEYYCVAKDGESIITSIGTLSIKDGKYDLSCLSN